MPDPLLVQVEARLEADAAVAALVTGGIYRRPLMKNGAEYAATPNAWAGTGQIRPTIVLRNEPAEPVGPGGNAEHQRIAVWMYAPTTDTGKVQLADMARLVRAALMGWRYVTSTGLVGRFDRAIGPVGYTDDPALLGTLVDTIRFQATALWRVPA